VCFVGEVIVISIARAIGDRNWMQDRRR